MPYKDIERQRAAGREAMRKKREGITGITEGITKGITGITKTEGITGPVKAEGITKVSQENRVSQEKVKPDVIPDQGKVTPALVVLAEGRDPRWVHLAEYIQEPCSGMGRLERMQRIAGSLGRYADQVYFGVGTETAISMEEVGKVIGILPPMITRA